MTPQEIAQQQYVQRGLPVETSHKIVHGIAAEVEVTKDQLNILLLEAHRKSISSTEEVAAIRELGRLNGLYTEKKEQDININITTNQQKLETLSDDELLKLAGSGEDLFKMPDVIDGEFEEVGASDEEESE